MLTLLLSHLSRVRPCTTASLEFSRQEHWSGLPFPSPVQKSESEVAQSWPTPRPHGLQPTRLLRPWDFPGKSVDSTDLLLSIFFKVIRGPDLNRKRGQSGQLHYFFFLFGLHTAQPVGS